MTDLLVATTGELGAALLDEVHRLVLAAFEGDFGDEDWAHALGGTHVVVSEDGVPVAHAAVVPRTLYAGGQALRTGYLEAVATAPAHQGRGLGSRAVSAASEVVRASYDMGALSTGRPAFYERLGWERWRGRTFVRDGGTLTRTADEDDGVLVLRYCATAGLDRTLDLACEARRGDDW